METIQSFICAYMLLFQILRPKVVTWHIQFDARRLGNTIQVHFLHIGIVTRASPAQFPGTATVPTCCPLLITISTINQVNGLGTRHYRTAEQPACSFQRAVRVLGPQVPAFEHARRRRSLRDPAWDKNPGLNWIVTKFFNNFLDE
jgi:hypothetical protein